MDMYDIHNHLIYKFDDGPRSLDEVVEMLKIARDQGITRVFATSHFQELIPVELEEDYFQKLTELQDRLEQENLPVQVFSGAEIFFHHYINETVKRSRVGTLAGLGKYVLLEFPLFLMPSGVPDALFKLKMDGFIPIIAHPERYSSVMENPEKVLEYLKYGALLQVNAGSLVGDFGRRVQRVAMWMMENRLVHFLGSDAHNPTTRTFRMADAVEHLKRHVDEDYVRDVVEHFPAKILKNEDIEKVNIPELEDQPGFLSRLKNKLFSLGR
ncbi:MAG: hypothetical protein GXO78_02510 [Calditrichaeota bacterium]|nr:hypothetical protein [Calditrichota bacterium]